MAGALAAAAASAAAAGNVSAGISLLSYATTSNASAGASLAINKPAGAANGNVLISIAHHSNSGATWTPGSGFTEIVDNAGSSFGEVARRTVDGSEAASFTFTCSTAAGTLTGGIICFQNGIFDVVGTPGGAGTTATAPSITMSGAGIVLAVYTRASSGVTFSTPSGFTPLWSDSDGSAPSIAVFWKSVAAGATGDISSVPSGGTASGYLIGIKST